MEYGTDNKGAVPIFFQPVRFIFIPVKRGFCFQFIEENEAAEPCIFVAS